MREREATEAVSVCVSSVSAHTEVAVLYQLQLAIATLIERFPHELHLGCPCSRLQPQGPPQHCNGQQWQCQKHHVAKAYVLFFSPR